MNGERRILRAVVLAAALVRLVSAQTPPASSDDPGLPTYWNKLFQIPSSYDSYAVVMQSDDPSGETARKTSEARARGGRVVWAGARPGLAQSIFALPSAEASSLCRSWAASPRTKNFNHSEFGDAERPGAAFKRKRALLLEQSKNLDVDAAPALAAVLAAKFERMDRTVALADAAEAESFVVLSVAVDAMSPAARRGLYPPSALVRTPALPTSEPSPERKRLTAASSQWPPRYWDRKSIPINCMPFRLATAVLTSYGANDGRDIPALSFPRYEPDCTQDGLPRGAVVSGGAVSFGVHSDLGGGVLNLGAV